MKIQRIKWQKKKSAPFYYSFSSSNDKWIVSLMLSESGCGQALSCQGNSAPGCSAAVCAEPQRGAAQS